MDTITAVEIMQEYIRANFRQEGFSAETVSAHAGYSRRHADRLFKKHTGKTLQEYIHAVCLTHSANELAATDQNVLDIALGTHFQSHEGFTRAFSKYFLITPARYREKQIPIPLFIQYPIRHYYTLLSYKEDANMTNQLGLCTVTPVKRLRRKLIFLPSRSAHDYLSYCEEMGCDWTGFFNSVPEKLDTAALLELPEALIPKGFSKIAAGIEVPLDYTAAFPPEYLAAELPECIMLYFQSEPYENEDDFCAAIDSTYRASARYQPEQYGFAFAYDLVPTFNFGATTQMGAKIAIPAVRTGK